MTLGQFALPRAGCIHTDCGKPCGKHRVNTVYRRAIPKISADCTTDDAPAALGASSGSFLNLSLYLAHTPGDVITCTS
jgi:hypothetical protein